jgi:hypothetical protein
MMAIFVFAITTQFVNIYFATQIRPHRHHSYVSTTARSEDLPSSSTGPATESSTTASSDGKASLAPPAVHKKHHRHHAATVRPQPATSGAKTETTTSNDNTDATADDQSSYSDYSARRRAREADTLIPWFFVIYMTFIFSIVIKAKGPSRIIVSDNGIKFKWYNLPSTFCIPWSAIETVSTREIQYYNFGKKLKEQFYNSRSIELNVSRSSFTILQWLQLQLFNAVMPDPVIPRFTSKNATLKLDAQAIIHEDDRQQFIKILEEKVGSEFMNPELSTLKGEGEADSSSFTKVWLDSMDNANRGLDPLANDAVLAGGEYQILNRIAAGGQAITYSAVRHTHKASDNSATPEESHTIDLSAKELDVVVLKEFVLPDRGGNKIRNRALANIDHEASLLKKLDHPQIVKLVDTFVQGHRAYLVMEKVDGQSLRQIVQSNGKFDESKVRLLAKQMCDILTYLHTQQPPIIHQDFTPDNLLLQADGQLVLIDFNVAEQLEQECTKTVVGKHCYMPPEQFRGHPSPQSDIYAMGGTLFYLLTGEDPEPISTSHPRSTNADVSEDLDSIIAHATNPDTKKRYTNAGEIEQDLVGIRQLAAPLS